MAIIHPFAHKPPCKRIYTKFNTAIWVADIITCDNFCGRLRGVILYGVEFRHFPLTTPVAVKIELALYRAARDHVQTLLQDSYLARNLTQRKIYIFWRTLLKVLLN